MNASADAHVAWSFLVALQSVPTPNDPTFPRHVCGPLESFDRSAPLPDNSGTVFRPYDSCRGALACTGRDHRVSLRTRPTSRSGQHRIWRRVMVRQLCFDMERAIHLLARDRIGDCCAATRRMASTPQPRRRTQVAKARRLRQLYVSSATSREKGFSMKGRQDWAWVTNFRQPLGRNLRPFCAKIVWDVPDMAEPIDSTPSAWVVLCDRCFAPLRYSVWIRVEDSVAPSVVDA